MSSTYVIDVTVAAEAPGVWELARPATDHEVAVSTDDPMPEGEVDGYLTAVQAADELSGLEQALDVRERAQREIVGRLGRLVRSGRIEQLEGLTPERS